MQLRHLVFMHRDIRNGWVDIQSGWVDLRVCGWMAGCSCATKIERTRTGCMIEYRCRHSVHACMEFYTSMCGLYHDVLCIMGSIIEYRHMHSTHACIELHACVELHGYIYV